MDTEANGDIVRSQYNGTGHTDYNTTAIMSSRLRGRITPGIILRGLTTFMHDWLPAAAPPLACFIK